MKTDALCSILQMAAQLHPPFSSQPPSQVTLCSMVLTHSLSTTQLMTTSHQ